MILSIGFSIVLYQTSISSLWLPVNDSSAIYISSNGQPAIHKGSGAGTGSESSSVNKSQLIANFNQQLQQNIDALKKSALERLVILNVAVFVVGAVLCSYLARRTLRPIEAAMEAQARFASDASHELRTPLTVMQAENEGALRMLDLSDSARAVLKSNLEEISQLRELTEGLLRLARDTEDMSLEPVWIDGLVEKAKKSVAKLASTKAIRIQVTVPHIQALADEPSLTQSIVILLDNAIQYSPEKSSVYIEGRAGSKQVTIHVRDEGPGIESTDLKHIFDRFYRAEQTREQHPMGHGLGLSLAQKLVKLQHGSIMVESTPGRGSTFTIKLQALGN